MLPLAMFLALVLHYSTSPAAFLLQSLHLFLQLYKYSGCYTRVAILVLLVLYWCVFLLLYSCFYIIYSCCYTIFPAPCCYMPVAMLPLLLLLCCRMTPAATRPSSNACCYHPAAILLLWY